MKNIIILISILFILLLSSCTEHEYSITYKIYYSEDRVVTETMKSPHPFTVYLKDGATVITSATGRAMSTTSNVEIISRSSRVINEK